MKKITLFTAIILCSLSLYAQHTFSIVAVDPETGEIGSAGATCIAAEDGALAISDIVLGVGAIHTQSFYLVANQNNARARMNAGDSPQEIMDWLVANDVQNNASERQYLAVDLNSGAPRAATFTGVDCFEEFIGVQGDNYAIAGNILISNDVVTDMENAFLNTEGSLAEKLMAALQGAKRPGADVRCLNEGVSSASAFIRVASPTDTDSSYGNLSLDLNVWITSEVFEPIDELQSLFDQSLSLADNETISGVRVYPNPVTSELTIKSVIKTDAVEMYNLLGQRVASRKIEGNVATLDVSELPNGVYFVNVTNEGQTRSTQKILVRK